MAISNIGNYGNANIYGNTYSTQKCKKADDVPQSTSKLSTNSGTSATKNDKKASSEDYFKSLKKLVPSCQMSIGNGISADKNSKTVTINPKILEKMQNDPQKEKDTTDLIKGIETAMNISESLSKAGGWEVKYSHWYVDQNGKCWHTAMTVKNDKLTKMVREKTEKSRQDFIEKSKANAIKKKEEFKKSMEKAAEKKAESAKEKAKHEETADVQTSDDTALSKAKKLLEDKISYSENGIFSFGDDDVKTFAEAAKENENPVEQEFLKNHLNVKA